MKPISNQFSGGAPTRFIASYNPANGLQTADEGMRKNLESAFQNRENVTEESVMAYFNDMLSDFVDESSEERVVSPTVEERKQKIYGKTDTKYSKYIPQASVNVKVSGFQKPQSPRVGQKVHEIHVPATPKSQQRIKVLTKTEIQKLQNQKQQKSNIKSTLVGSKFPQENSKVPQSNSKVKESPRVSSRVIPNHILQESGTVSPKAKIEHSGKTDSLKKQPQSTVTSSKMGDISKSDPSRIKTQVQSGVSTIERSSKQVKKQTLIKSDTSKTNISSKPDPFQTPIKSDTLKKQNPLKSDSLKKQNPIKSDTLRSNKSGYTIEVIKSTPGTDTLNRKNKNTGSYSVNLESKSEIVKKLSTTRRAEEQSREQVDKISAKLSYNTVKGFDSFVMY